MADNYLERRMEDLRSGRIAASAHAHSAAGRPNQAPKGKLAELHAVITGYISADFIETASTLRSAGASVDILAADSRAGNTAAQRSGARFHPTDLGDTNILKNKLLKIIEERGSIDILIHFAESAEPRALAETDLQQLFERTRRDLAVPAEAAQLLVRQAAPLSAADSYGGRMILATSSNYESDDYLFNPAVIAQGAASALADALKGPLSAIGFTVNVLTPRAKRIPGALARTVSFLCERTSGFISGQKISVG